MCPLNICFCQCVSLCSLYSFYKNVPFKLAYLKGFCVRPHELGNTSKNGKWHFCIEFKDKHKKYK